MKPSAAFYLKLGLGLLLGILLLVILLINFTSSQNLPELVRVQVERYAVCSYWFFGWHLASTGGFALVFLVLGLLLGTGLGVLLARRLGARPRG